MVVWVVKAVEYEHLVYGYLGYVDVYGVYSSLALAGRAVMQSINYAMMQDPELVITFNCYEESWGYSFPLTARACGDVWQYGEIEISRVMLNK